MRTKTMTPESLKQIGMTQEQFDAKIKKMIDSVTDIVDLDGDKSIGYKVTTSSRNVVFFEFEEKIITLSKNKFVLSRFQI
jgi:hypothetical protein